MKITVKVQTFIHLPCWLIKLLPIKKPFFKKKKPNSLNVDSLIKDVKSGVRPKFKKYKNSKMKELISQCWSQDPKERPSFDAIFEKLSTDFSYFDDEINESEVNKFLEMLKGNNNNIDDDLTDEQQKKMLDSYVEIVNSFINSSENVYDIYINFKSIVNFACESGNLKLVKNIISLDQIDLTASNIYIFFQLITFDLDSITWYNVSLLGISVITTGCAFFLKSCGL